MSADLNPDYGLEVALGPVPAPLSHGKDPVLPSQDTSSDLAGVTHVCAPGKGQLSENPTEDPEVDPCPCTMLLYDDLEAVPCT